MHHLLKIRLLLTLVFALIYSGIESLAIPAKPGKITYKMPNGQTITVQIFGDEHHHFFTTTDGYVLLRKEHNTFHYAIPSGDKFVDSNIIATDVKDRPANVRKMLDGIDRKASLQTMQKMRQRNIQKSPGRVAPENQLCSFPTKGSPHILCILVEFQDVKFTVDNPKEVFKNQLTQKGFDRDGATGSILDYFTASSNGQFTPQIDLYGPVTLNNNMKYYGGNDAMSKNDLNPEEMVIEACEKLDDEIDFTLYDNDNDGIIDNVYIFYAGYGEADGGSESSVWPHSWDITEAVPGQDFFFDGKRLNHYACNNELRDGNGSLLSGIGVFCHEFSHVLGLPDLYSTNYSGAFTPGTWSLMDQGSYNNNARTPPLHTAYERYCFGWLEPKELKDACNVMMRSISDVGYYDDAYIIKTNKPTEYFILENRQQKGWDKYIKGHGMLIWHIDFVPEMWEMNICNVQKQHIDIIEADNHLDYFSIEGDPFPGSNGVTSFTDDTTPSMITWTGEKLHAPITEIKEDNGVISFMFKGGQDIFNQVVANNPSRVKAGGFTAEWMKQDRANGYLLSVYTMGNDGSKTYIEGYNMRETGDVSSYEITGLTPSTTYYYNVRATDGKFYSKESNTVEVTTLDPTIDFKTVITKEATEVGATSFKANWEPLDEAEYYSLSVFTMQLGSPFTDEATFNDNALPEGWTADSKSFDNRSAYSKEAPSLRLGDGQFIATKIYDRDIRTFSFWYRGNVSNTENSLSVYGNVNGEMKELKTINPVSNASGGTMVELENIPAGCKQIKLVFHRPNSGYIYIDDIMAGYGGNYEELPIQGLDGLNVGKATSHLVTGLTTGKTYSYAVYGHKDDLKSKEPVRIRVTLNGTDGIDDVTTGGGNSCRATAKGIEVTVSGDTQVSIYDMSGKTVASQKQQQGTFTYDVAQPGVYVVKTGAGIFKVTKRN